jgi:hypothetical protein
VLHTPTHPAVSPKLEFVPIIQMFNCQTPFPFAPNCGAVSSGLVAALAPFDFFGRQPPWVAAVRDYSFSIDLDDLVNELVRDIHQDGVTPFLAKMALPVRALPKNASPAQEWSSNGLDIFGEHWGVGLALARNL